MTPIISVLIPVYNVEEYVEQSVRSVFEQSVTDNIEFIFVNDKTPDKSMQIINKICNEYPELGNQIHFFHNIENRGIGYVREELIKKAKGKYVCFIDSDDWVDNSYFEKLLIKAEAENADIVTCNMTIVLEKKTYTLKKYTKKISEKKEFLHQFVRYGKDGVLIAKLIKRELFISYVAQMHEQINFGEDHFIMAWLLCKAQNIYNLADPLYYYNRTNLTSLTHNISPAMIAQSKKIDEEIGIILSKNNLLEFYFEDYQYRLIRSILNRILTLQKIDLEDFEELKKLDVEIFLHDKNTSIVLKFLLKSYLSKNYFIVYFILFLYKLKKNF